MLNQVVLVGRITADPEVYYNKDNDKKYSHITLAVPRSFKNASGEYDTDFIRLTLFDKVAESTASYCKTGDTIGNKSVWYTDG